MDNHSTSLFFISGTQHLDYIMFTNNKSFEGVSKLILEFKNYLELQKEFATLSMTEKLTIIFSAMITTLVLILLGFVVLLFTTFALAYYLGDLLHSLPLGFACTALLITAITLLFYARRTQWVIEPIARFMSNLFMRKPNEQQ